MNRLITAVLTTVASAGLLLGTTTAPAAAITAKSYDSQVVSQTNKERKAHGRTALKHHSCLNGHAQRWANTMAKRGKLEHRTTASMRRILKKCNLRSYGENIATGFTSGKAAVNGWMNSSGHRANILKSSYRLIAVGTKKDSSGRWWAVQVFGRR